MPTAISTVRIAPRHCRLALIDAVRTNRRGAGTSREGFEPVVGLLPASMPANAPPRLEDSSVTDSSRSDVPEVPTERRESVRLTRASLVARSARARRSEGETLVLSRLVVSRLGGVLLIELLLARGGGRAVDDGSRLGSPFAPPPRALHKDRQPRCSLTAALTCTMHCLPL